MPALRFALLLLISLFVTVPQEAFASAEAGKYIEALGNQTLKVVANNGGKEQKQAQLEKIFSSNVDIPWIGRFVMGRYWRQASEQQKSTYLKKYEGFLVKHYASRFTDYTSGSFKVTDTRDDGNGEYTVSMEIDSPERQGGEPILVDYRVRGNPGSFKIFDVTVEGVSMITTQRSEFSSVIGQHGIDYLIENLSVISQQSLPDNK